MIKNYFFIARKFLSNRGSKFSLFMSRATAIGIAISVSCLIVIISIMNGFEKQLIDRTLSVEPHIELYTADKRHSEDIALVDGIMGLSIAQEHTAVIKSKGEIAGVKVMSISPDNSLRLVDVMGDKNSIFNDGYIALGVGLSKKINATIGDRVNIIYQNEKNQTKTKVKKVGYIYEVGLHSFDTNVLMMSVETSESIWSSGEYVIHIRVDNPHDVEKVNTDIKTIIGCDNCTTTWKEKNKILLSALETEKRVMMIIMFLVIVITLFNLITSLVMTIKDKSAEISILKSLGYTRFDILSIFMIQGWVLGLVGSTIGVALGVLVSINVESIVSFIEGMMGSEILSSEIYYISTITSDIRINEVAYFYILSILLSVMATSIPAAIASKIEIYKGMKG